MFLSALHRGLPAILLGSIALVLGACAPAIPGAASAIPSVSKPAPAATSPLSSPVSSPAVTSSPSGVAVSKPASSPAASPVAKPAASPAASAVPSPSAAPVINLTAAFSVATLSVQSTSLGNVLATSSGLTLYSHDDPSSANANDPTKCTGACLVAWPPLLSSDIPTTPVGVTGKLGIITRADQTVQPAQPVKQVTYNDVPVYLSIQDRQPGETNGHGSKTFGGNWQVIKIS